jgi:hypothetical protein
MLVMSHGSGERRNDAGFCNLGNLGNLGNVGNVGNELCP